MCASYDDITKLSNVLQRVQNKDLKDESDNSSVDSNELVTYIDDIDTTDSIVLTNCNDPLIKQALILNVRKRQALGNIIKTIQDTLLQINHVRNEYRLRLVNGGHTKRKNKIKKRLGTPYFKNIDAFPSPRNSDWLQMRENKQLQENQLIRTHWTQEDKCNLMRGVFNAICLKKIEELTHFIQFSKDQKICDKLIEEKNIFINTALLKKLLDNWNTLWNIDSLSSEEKLIVNTVINWDEELDWLQISNHFLKGRHPDAECRAMWNCYLSPKYSKENWTKHEDDLLVALCEKYKFENWEAIAKDFSPTCRSAYQCCVHFHANLCEQFNRDRWTPEEDTYLRHTIENCTTGMYISWGRVAYYFNHRSKRQIYRHYNACGGRNIKKGNFSIEEDILLLILVNIYNDNLRKIGSYFPHRMLVQLKNRIKTLSKDVGRPWSIQEDSSIIAHVARHGQKNWKLLKEINRSEDCIRHRCRIINNFFEMNPGSTVFEIPRRNGFIYRGNIRKRIRVVKKIVTDILNKLQINFKEDILSLKYIRKFLKPHGTLLEEQNPKPKKELSISINNLLQQLFVSSYRCVLRTPVTYTEHTIHESADRIESLLKMLEANIIFPNLDKIETHPDLDDMDKHIIKRIIANNEEDSKCLQKSIISATKCIPPTIENLIGFRGILLHAKTLKLHARGKYEGYPVYCKSQPNYNYTQHGYYYNKSVLENMFAKSSEEIKQIVIRNEQLFMKRLRILYQWTYIIADTPVKPDIKVKVEEKERQKPGPKKKELKLYKIQLMNQARSKAAAERRRLREAADCDNPAKKIKLH